MQGEFKVTDSPEKTVNIFTVAGETLLKYIGAWKTVKKYFCYGETINIFTSEVNISTDAGETVNIFIGAGETIQN